MLAAVDTVSGTLYTSDGNTRFLYRWNDALQLSDSVYVGSPAVSASFFTDPNGRRNGMFSTLGTMQAKDVFEGRLLRYELLKNPLTAADTLAKKLPRPVQSIATDLNNDGRKDWVVCGFGHKRGGLYWLEALPQGGFKQNTIAEVPGAIKAVAHDFNYDGRTDFDGAVCPR
jgi:hypothetical protein